MENILKLNRYIIPVEQIVGVEPYDPAANPEFRTERTYRSRVILLNRESHLAEDTVESLTTRLALRFLAEDQTAFNPTVEYQVEYFSPSETFKPERPFKSRLVWRDADGNKQSKLLKTNPAIVVTTLLRADLETAPKSRPKRVQASRGSKRLPAARS
jgi:hypothetical protein